jgi:hypothetical protein
MVAQLVNLRKVAKRMTTRMSLDPVQGMNLASLWVAIPEAIRGEHPMPGTTEDAIKFLENLQTTPEGYVVAAPVSAPQGENAACSHPEELARTLGDDERQEWRASLLHVEELIYQPPQNTVAAQVTATSADQGLFRASDVPEFKDRKDYWSYRSSLQRFFGSIIVRPQQVKLALNRILSRFSGNVSDAAQRWNIDSMSRNNFEIAATDFIAELDRRFLSPEFFREQTIELRRCHPKKGQSAQDFLLDFETIVRTLDEAAFIAGTSPMSQPDIIRQLLAVLPAHVRDALYLWHEYPENMEFSLLHPKLIRIWNNTPGPAVVQTTANNTGRTVSHRNANSRPGAFGACNKPCWDSNPAVPDKLRGAARRADGTPRNDLSDRCFRCRRTAADHNGQISGCTSYGVHKLHNSAPNASQQTEKATGTQ